MSNLTHMQLKNKTVKLNATLHYTWNSTRHLLHPSQSHPVSHPGHSSGMSSSLDDSSYHCCSITQYVLPQAEQSGSSVWSESMSLDHFLVHADDWPAEEDAALFLRACFHFLPFPFGCSRLEGTPRANSSSACS